MKLSDIHPLPQYFGRYMALCDNVSISEITDQSKAELTTIPLDLWEKIGDRVYAEGKWTLKSIIQHLIDTERIFIYRALSYARGETETMLSFDENVYADNAEVGHRSLQGLIAELSHTHESLRLLFESLPENKLDLICQGIAGEYTVGAVPFIMAGHQKWHFRVIEERYLPLLNQ